MDSVKKEADEHNFPEELINQCISGQQSFDKMTEILKPVMEMRLLSLDSIKKLDPLDRARLLCLKGFYMNTLFWMYLSALGYNPKQHKIKEELERYKHLITEIKEVAQERKASKLNKAVADSFVRNALWVPKEQRESRKEPEVSRKEPEVSRKEPEVSEESEEGDPTVEELLRYVLGGMRPRVSSKEPGVSSKEPGVSRKEPGASRKEPGASRKEPGPSRKEPGPFRKEPGPSRKEPGVTHKVPEIINLESSSDEDCKCEGEVVFIRDKTDEVLIIKEKTDEVLFVREKHGREQGPSREPSSSGQGSVIPKKRRH